MKKSAKKVTIKGKSKRLMQQNANLKRVPSAKIKKSGFQVQKQQKNAQKKEKEIEKLKPELEKARKDLSKLKKESSSKIKELQSKMEHVTEELEKTYKELHVFKDFLNKKETELNQLRVEVEYKNKLLAPRDLEMESYKKVTEETIFRLDARVKELEGKA